MIKIDFNIKPTIMPEYVMTQHGDKCLYDENGKLHSYNDLPAVVAITGTKCWYKHGLLHRENDQPAVTRKRGSKFWYKNGKRHRDNNLPASIFITGLLEWYVDGKFVKHTGAIEDYMKVN